MAFSKKKDSAQLLVVLCVLGVFVIFSLLLIVFGARAYQRVGRRMTDTDQVRTSLNYVANKVRFSPGGDSLQLDTVNGVQVLKMEEGDYQDCIYYYRGNLMEAYLDGAADFVPETGDSLVALPNFHMEKTDAGLFRFTAETSGGEAVKLEIGPGK